MGRLLVAVALLRATLAEYDGGCDDTTSYGMHLEAGALYRTIYTTFYDGGCDGPTLSSGTSMNYESLNCGTVDDGQVCLRCIEGVVNVGRFASDVDVFAVVTDDAAFASAATDVTPVDNCNDGCGETCYGLGDALSFRLAWHSADQPLCDAAPVCPDESEEVDAAAPAARPPAAALAALAGGGALFFV